MKENSKILLLLYFVLPQLVLGVTEKCGNPKNARIQSYRTSRMVGGEDFKRGDFPWMVALTRNSNNKDPDFFCAGTLVSNRHVITGID